MLQKSLFPQNPAPDPSRFFSPDLPSKIFWTDTETTGVDPRSNAVVQIAGIIEIDHEIVEEFELFAAPHEGAAIEQGALDVNKRTIEELIEFPPLAQTVDTLKGLFRKYVSPYQRNDKFVVAGYNVGFDYDFLYQAFKRVGDRYGIGSWTFHAKRDVMSTVADAITELGFRPGNTKLSAVCDALSIDLDAHDALNDVRATRTVYHTLLPMIVQARRREAA